MSKTLQDIIWILDTRHTVPLGTRDTDIYAPRITKYIEDRENKLVKKLSFHTGIPTEVLEGYLRSKYE